jgi:hypothetical protein
VGHINSTPISAAALRISSRMRAAKVWSKKPRLAGKKPIFSPFRLVPAGSLPEFKVMIDELLMEEIQIAPCMV